MNSKQIYKITATLTPTTFIVDIRKHTSNRVGTEQIRFLEESEEKISVMKYCIDGDQGQSKVILIQHIRNKLAVRKQKLERMISKLHHRHSYNNTRYFRTKNPIKWNQLTDFPD
ncbi:MAG: hypothetical protein PHW73_00085 [Atribacterota bacterium]|nr:hypothetical protein [Atribacterota bacterium]